MKSVAAEDFLRSIAAAGVGFDPRYPDSRQLRFLPPREYARFWVVPSNHADWPPFLATVLTGLDGWAGGFLWPRSGSWPDPVRSELYSEGVRDVFLRGAGINAGSVDAVLFAPDEEDELIAVLYAYLAFGWCSEDDLFFIPDHGRQVLQTSHHEVVHVECLSEERMQTLVDYMKESGYPLPTEPPDATFKRPAWMGSTLQRNRGLR